MFCLVVDHENWERDHALSVFKQAPVTGQIREAILKYLGEQRSIDGADKDCDVDEFDYWIDEVSVHE